MCTNQDLICIEITDNEVKIYSVLFANYSSLSSLTLTIEDIYNNTSTDSEVLSGDIVDNEHIVKEISDGIYKLNLKGAYTNGNIVNYHACAFVDTEYKCDLVNASVDGIMMHYALTKVNGCSCNCDDMKEIFETMLAEIDKTKTNCKSC